MDGRSLTKKQRELRAAILIRDQNRCRYCGETAHQIDFIPGEETAVACCRTCLMWLKKTPPDWTVEQRQHLIDTMKIAHPVKKPPRPRFSTAHIKRRYPIHYTKEPPSN